MGPAKAGSATLKGLPNGSEAGEWVVVNLDAAMLDGAFDHLCGPVAARHPATLGDLSRHRDLDRRTSKARHRQSEISMGACKLLFLKEFLSKTDALCCVGLRTCYDAGPQFNACGSARGMAQSGSASALGAEGRGFESLCPDQFRGGLYRTHPLRVSPGTLLTPFSQRDWGLVRPGTWLTHNPRTAVPRRHVLWWAVGYNARPRTRCARIPGIDLIIRLARGLFDHRARSSTG